MATCDLEGGKHLYSYSPSSIKKGVWLITSCFSAGGEQRVEKGQRDRSKSFSAGQRPTPKPRRPAPRRSE